MTETIASNPSASATASTVKQAQANAIDTRITPLRRFDIDGPLTPTR